MDLGGSQMWLLNTGLSKRKQKRRPRARTDLISRVDRDHHDSSDWALIWMIMPSARLSWWHCCLLAYFRVRATNNLFDNGRGSSIVVPSKQDWLAHDWMTPALQLLELLMSTLKNTCLWNMQNTPTLSSLNHNVPSPLPASWSGSNLHICTSFQVSISLSFSLLFSLQCSFIARRRTSRLKKETSQPELGHNWHKPRTLLFFFCESISNYNLKCSWLERGTNATWRTPSLAPENDFFFSLLSFCSLQMNLQKLICVIFYCKKKKKLLLLIPLSTIIYKRGFHSSTSFLLLACAFLM